MFKALMIMTTVITGVLTAGLTVLWAVCPLEWIEVLAITVGTCFYHFAMRLLVGYTWSLHPTHDPSRRWFCEKVFEKRLYKVLGVRHWKRYAPTFNPDTFDVQLHSPTEIVNAMCHSELVHESIAVLSFVPLLAAVPFGEFWVFLLTSVFAAMYDLSFVAIQRYNRPRVMRLIKRRKKQSSDDAV